MPVSIIISNCLTCSISGCLPLDPQLARSLDEGKNFLDLFPQSLTKEAVHKVTDAIIQGTQQSRWQDLWLSTSAVFTKSGSAVCMCRATHYSGIAAYGLHSFWKYEYLHLCQKCRYQHTAWPVSQASLEQKKALNSTLICSLFIFVGWKVGMGYVDWVEINWYKLITWIYSPICWMCCKVFACRSRGHVFNFKSRLGHIHIIARSMCSLAQLNLHRGIHHLCAVRGPR